MVSKAFTIIGFAEVAAVVSKPIRGYGFVNHRIQGLTQLSARVRPLQSDQEIFCIKVRDVEPGQHDIVSIGKGKACVIAACEGQGQNLSI